MADAVREGRFIYSRQAAANLAAAGGPEADRRRPSDEFAATTSAPSAEV
jgi:hypothetical protein